MMARDDVTIRPARSVEEFQACQEAQRLAWGITDSSYLVPLATLVGVQQHGGLVLGAFLADGSAVGMSFAFLGKVRGKLCLYSQLTGVVPGRQGQKLGLRLKHAQRDFCRREGIDRIAWSFDPLQAGNAHFNLNHLGAVAVRYVVDMYGRRTDALNAGTPTDRLIAEWAVGPAGSPTPTVDIRRARWAVEGRARPDGLLEPVASVDETEVNPSGPTLVEIPDDVGTIRRRDPELAEAWVLAIRRAFDEAFGAGRVAEGFLRDDSAGRRRCSYVLRAEG